MKHGVRSKAEAYFMLNDKLLADTLKIAFTHALETIPNVLLDK
jgi:hypothetical protein